MPNDFSKIPESADLTLISQYCKLYSSWSSGNYVTCQENENWGTTEMQQCLEKNELYMNYIILGFVVWK